MRPLTSPSRVPRAANSLGLPKVDLHIHLDLAASYGAVAALAPDTTLADYRRNFIGPPRIPSLPDLLARTHRFLALMQDERGLRVVVEDLFEQLVQDSVVYAELRFAPLQHTERSLLVERVVEIVERATADAIATTGIEARLLLCTLRHFSAEQSLQTAQLVHAFAGSLVTGFDIAGDEAGHPLERHVPAFRWAADRGIPITAHAGEGAGPDSVEETVRRLDPGRIGHGVRSVEDPVVIALLKDQQIHLEVCPSSNVQIDLYPDYDDHPIENLRRSAVSFSIGTDCRALTDVSLAREYERLRAAFGWTDGEFHACNRAALQAAFVEEDVRQRLLDELEHRADGAGAHRPAPRVPIFDSGAGTSDETTASFARSIQTLSGRWVDPFEPDAAAFEIGDIAQALANQCRFGGHSQTFYSVAQHCVIVSELVLDRGANSAMGLAALLHDAAEAYLVDLPHPLKHRSELGPPYRRAEAMLEQAIRERFDLPILDPELKRLDRRLLATERLRFTSATGDWIELGGFEPLELDIVAWEPRRAAREFLAQFERLDHSRASQQALA